MPNIDKLAWIHIKDRKTLFVRSKGKDIFYIPGGKRETGESDQQALIREIKEELDADVIPESLKYLHTFSAQAHGKPEGVMVELKCFFANYTGALAASAEIEELAWLESSDMNKTPPAGQLILAWLKDKDLID